MTDDDRTEQESLQRLPDVPDHTILRRIGGGGYGEVWLARNVVGTYRAVKFVFRNKFQNAAPYEREFNGIRKFEPISRSHEGLVDILQIGRNDSQGYFYYVMELGDDQQSGQQIDPVHYVSKTLQREIAHRHQLPLDDCLLIGLSLADALQHVHRHGLIHRDIKPSNIIFVNGVLKLADIGLVTEAREQASFVGTPGFIPPEGPGTAQADIFSLGKVLYEITMGKDPREFPDPVTNLASLPNHERLLRMNAIILKACRSAPAQRYQSAQELHEDLASLQGGLEKTSWPRVLAATLGLFLLAGIAGAFFHFKRLPGKQGTISQPPAASLKTVDANAAIARSKSDSTTIASLLTERSSRNVNEFAIPFLPPPGSGRRNRRGLMVFGNSSFDALGSTWQFDYQRNDRGVQLLHPFGSGQCVITIHRVSLGLSTPARWLEIGYGSGNTNALARLPAYTNFFPLLNSGNYHIRTTVMPSGAVSVFFNGSLVATGAVSNVHPIDFTVGPDEIFSGMSDWDSRKFEGKGFPLIWPKGSAGIIIEPVDTGFNKLFSITYYPGF